MTSILDIAPPEIASKEVAIERVGKTLTVVGLDATSITKLIKRFPKFRMSATGRKLTDEDELDLGMEATPAIIAMGLRSYDEETEKLVQQNLTLEEQALLLDAILSLTNPDAPRKDGPFAKARAAQRGGVVSGRAQAGTSP